jgi:hypothetical protein
LHSGHLPNLRLDKLQAAPAENAHACKREREQEDGGALKQERVKR